LRERGLNGKANGMGELVRLGVAFGAAAVLAACGSSSSGSSAGKGDASAGDDATEVGDAGDEGASGYPAFPVDAPQILKNGGAVLGSPVVVTITWPGEGNASTWESFGDGIGASSFWSATTAEYGVGAATSGAANHVRMTQGLPATLGYYDVSNLVMAAVQAVEPGDAGATDAGVGGPAWPAPVLDAKGNAQTIYALYIPATTTVTDPGSGASFCAYGALGWHDEVTVNGVGIPFAVTLECPSMTLDVNEETASHELVEAATDPYMEPAPTGYSGYDAEHLAWAIYEEGYVEVADACQNWQDSYVQESGSFPYWVQLSWSNAAAKAGHDPCAPAPTTPYYGMTLFPAQESTVTVNPSAIGVSGASTKGFKATVGQPLTFQVGYYSDASAAPWKIAYDFPASLGGSMGGSLSNGKATVAIDQTTGQNGDKANVTVTVSEKGGGGFHVMAITWDAPSSKDFLPHYLPLVIVDE
jgi:hypothetical protein